MLPTNSTFLQNAKYSAIGVGISARMFQLERRKDDGTWGSKYRMSAALLSGPGAALAYKNIQTGAFLDIANMSGNMLKTQAIDLVKDTALYTGGAVLMATAWQKLDRIHRGLKRQSEGESQVPGASRSRKVHGSRRSRSI
jgi:hypothetical protein